MKIKLSPTTAYKVAEVELVYKSKTDIRKRPQITGAHDAYKLFISQWDKNKIELQEQFKVMLLSRGKRVLGIYQASTGGIQSTVADVSLVFATVLKARASSIILAHNHPSGELDPSECDRVLTRQLIKAGRLLSITVLDHLIVTRYDYYSFAQSELKLWSG
jgi:DNA repair proteins